MKVPIIIQISDAGEVTGVKSRVYGGGGGNAKKERHLKKRF